MWWLDSLLGTMQLLLNPYKSIEKESKKSIKEIIWDDKLDLVLKH
jgi:hypothetical protein